MACAGDVPTLETLAAAAWLRDRFSDLKVRVVNVVDRMTLEPNSEHPHGFSIATSTYFHPRQADHFCVSRLPVAHPPATYRRTNHANLHVRGYKEGVRPRRRSHGRAHRHRRYHLASDVIDRVPASRAGLQRQASLARQFFEHRESSRASATTCRRSATGAGRSAIRNRDRMAGQPEGGYGQVRSGESSGGVMARRLVRASIMFQMRPQRDDSVVQTRSGRSEMIAIWVSPPEERHR